MPNISSILRSEIVRLARKEIKGQSIALSKASTRHRHDLAALKRHIGGLESSLKRLATETAKSTSASFAVNAPVKAIRFSAKSLRSQRKRLGLTMAELGTLLEISGQSVYNWESETTRPRASQIEKIATLRGMSKRAAIAQVESKAHSPGKKTTAKKVAAPKNATKKPPSKAGAGIDIC